MDWIDNAAIRRKGMVGCTGTFVLLSVTAIFLLDHLPMASGGADRPWKAPPGGLDGYTTGLGFMDVSSDEFYHDADERPIQKEGMPVEMKKMIANAEAFHQHTLVNTGLENRQLERQRRKELELPEQRIPRKIWQVCYEEPLPRVLRAYSETWSNENEEYVHTLCSAEEARSLVEEFYPELLTVYDGLKEQSKQDFFMYLVLFKFGGVFASIDATCELPLRKLVRADDDMLVGHQPVLTSRVLQRQVRWHRCRHCFTECGCRTGTLVRLAPWAFA